ncbi:MAG: hypothetical protein V1697_02040 [Candidatus Levyibacteriota bacterium]
MDDGKKFLGKLGKGIGKTVGSEIKNIANSTMEQIDALPPKTKEGEEKSKTNTKKPVDQKEREQLIEGLYGKSENDDKSSKTEQTQEDPVAQKQEAEKSDALAQEEKLKKQKLEQLRSQLHQEAQRLGVPEKREETVQDRLEEEDAKDDQKKQMEAIEVRKKAPITPPRKGPERKLGIGG